MTNEKREAIEYLERQIRVCNENAEICDDNNFDEEATHLREESYMLDTVLALIKEQQEEIEGLKDKEVLIKRYFNKCDLIDKKDKQIDLMARAFKQDDVRTVEEIKQYFAGLVEKE